MWSAVSNAHAVFVRFCEQTSVTQDDDDDDRDEDHDTSNDDDDDHDEMKMMMMLTMSTIAWRAALQRSSTSISLLDHAMTMTTTLVMLFIAYAIVLAQAKKKPVILAILSVTGTPSATGDWHI